MRLLFLWLAIGSVPACKDDEADGGPLSADDVDRLTIAPVDAATVSVLGTSGTVEAGAAIHVENVTAGAGADTQALDDGGFTVSLSGGVDHVYALRSGHDRTFQITTGPSGETALAFGLGFDTVAGCELLGWSGIIEEREGEPREKCSVRGSIIGDEEVVRGPVGDVVLRRDTRLVFTVLVVGVDGAPARFSVDFVDVLGTTRTIDVAPPTAGAFTPTELVIGQVSPDLIGLELTSIAVRAAVGSGLDVADLSGSPIDVPLQI